MTNLNAASAVEASPSSRIALSSSAGVVVAFTGALFALSAVARFVGYYWGSTLVEQVYVLNAGELLAFLAVFAIVRDPQFHLSGRDLLVVASCSLSFLPSEPQGLPFLGATLAGLYFCWAGRNPQLRSVGQIWLALSACEAWGRLILRIVAVPVLHAESGLIVKLGKLLGFGISLDGVLIRAPSGWAIYLLSACSAFHNVTFASLVWLSLLKLSGGQADLRKVAGLICGIAGIVLLNSYRILLMSNSEDAYLFWHLGNGQIIYSTLALLVIALPSVIQMRSPGR